MIVSVHLADLDPRAAGAVLLRPPKPAEVPGLSYAVTTTTAPLGAPLLPPTQLGRCGLRRLSGMPGLPARALPVPMTSRSASSPWAGCACAAWRRSALLADTGLARPPHLVATFTLWRTAAAMRATPTTPTAATTPGPGRPRPRLPP
jgi:hypothetical protein